MDASIVSLLLPLVLPPVCTEGVLWVLRFLRVQKKGYAWTACLLRASTYAPCLLGIGDGALPMPLGAALCIWLDGPGGVIECFYGIPILALMPFTYGFAAVAAEKREARRADKLPG